MSDYLLQSVSAPKKAEGRVPQAITWYRTKIPSDTVKKLHEKSDWRGGFQTLLFLGLLVFTGSLAFYASLHGPVWLTILLIFLHGTFYNFLIPAIHELGHGTVFRTKFLNEFFLRVFSFFALMNYEMFGASHLRHHRYTLHQPDDLEVVLPIRLRIQNYLSVCILAPAAAYTVFQKLWEVACGKLEGEWDLTLYPESEPEMRKGPIRWARFLLVGHGLILVVSIYFHFWIIPVLTTFATFYARWLSFLCGQTQHIGLQDHVSDFRLSCRTFTANPVLEFLYWYMNYHIEHHMYAAVPCYNLKKLHQLIQHDLPPSPHGLIATWEEIIPILKIQETNPAYQYVAPLPGVIPEKAMAA